LTGGRISEETRIDDATNSGTSAKTKKKKKKKKKQQQD
jgi:hypothetical protein